MGQALFVSLGVIILIGGEVTLLAWKAPAVAKARDRLGMRPVSPESLRRAVLLTCWPIVIAGAIIWFLLLR